MSDKIKLVLDKINKNYGQGSISMLGDKKAIDVEAYSTGSLGLDICTGVGGFPRGRVTEIFGTESSTKTTTCIHAIADCQKKGHIAAFIDVEQSYDPKYSEKLGVDNSTLIFSQPNSAEEALNIVEELVRSGEVGLVVVDSVAALVPMQEVEGEMGDTKIGLQARLMSQAMRKLTPLVSKSNTALVFINQIREKVGVMYGSPEVVPGGNALKFYSSLRIELRRSTQIKDKDSTISGNQIKGKCVKNKLAPPYRSCTYDVIYGKGISFEGEILDIGSELDIVKKSGSWYSYGEMKLGQGKEGARDFLIDNPELRDEIAEKIREKYANA